MVGIDVEEVITDHAAWTPPTDLGQRMTSRPEQAAWFGALTRRADDLAQRWRLRPDGAPWSGFWSAVWPARTDHDRPVALKLTVPTWPLGPEVTALQAWDGHGAVRCLDYSGSDNALLLERLDGHRSAADLEDIDDACLVVAGTVARLHRASVPTGFRHLADEATRIADEIRRLAAAKPSLLPPTPIARALDTLDLITPHESDRLLHADAHFLNVLPTLDDPDAWRAIDPFPFVGPVEWELIPVLRNRWDDAAPDPDRALCRRVDQMGEVLGADRARARACAQAAAVANLLDLLPEQPGHVFVPPYAVMADW